MAELEEMEDMADMEQIKDHDCTLYYCVDEDVPPSIEAVVARCKVTGVPAGSTFGAAVAAVKKASGGGEVLRLRDGDPQKKRPPTWIQISSHVLAYVCKQGKSFYFKVLAVGVLYEQAAAVAASLKADTYDKEGVGDVTIPVVLAVPERSKVILRQCTENIAGFISRCFEEFSLARDMDRMAFITGTPGSGKTTSVICAFGHLYREFASRREEFGERIVYMTGNEFVVQPFATFFDALFLAYIDDQRALERLKSMKSFEQLRSFVRYGTSTKVYIIIDDGNAMDEDDEHLKRPHEREQREEAWRLVRSLSFLSNCFVIICTSIRSTLRHELIHDKPLHMFLNGGYTKTELEKYLRCIAGRSDMLRDPELKAQTGYVPRLVRNFLFLGLEKATRDYNWYQRGIGKYISTLLNNKTCIMPDELEEMKNALAGLAVPPIPSCLDSGCFYRNEIGNAVCVAPGLQSYAQAFYTTAFKATTENAAKEEVETWVSRVRADTNLARIGWNAEGAALLVFKLLRPEVQLRDEALLKFEPEVVASFRTFSWDLFKQYEGRKAFLIPERYNNLGVDFYYQDEKYRVAVQVSVGKNARKRHKRTVEVIKSAPEEGRKKVLLWVLHAADWSVEEVPEYAEALLSFGQLSVTLADIDKTCTELKQRKPAGYGDSCALCYQYECLSVDNWVQCEGCACWVHNVCAGLQTANVARYYCGACEGLAEEENRRDEACEEKEDEADEAWSPLNKDEEAPLNKDEEASLNEEGDEAQEEDEEEFDRRQQRGEEKVAGGVKRVAERVTKQPRKLKRVKLELIK